MRNFLSLLLVLPGILFGQSTFNVRLADSTGTGSGGIAIELSDWGYVVTGIAVHPYPPYNQRLRISGLNLEGELLYDKKFGPDTMKWFAGWCNSTAPTTDGNFILGGHARKPGANLYEPYLIKFTPDGDTLWKSSFYSELMYLGNAGCQAVDGGYVLIGNTQDVDSPEIPWFNGFIMKTDGEGNFLWLKKYYHLQYQVIFMSVVPMPDGGIVAAGSRQWLGTNGNDFDWFALRTDSIGNEIWRKAWGTPQEDHDIMINLASDGNLLVSGFSLDPASNPLNFVGFHYAAKLNSSNGSVMWERYIAPSVQNSLPYKILETSDGEIIVGGNRRTNFPIVEEEPWYEFRGSLWKLSAEGDSLWLRTYAFADGHPCHFRDVIETPDGGFAAVGVAEVSPGYVSDDTWVVKVDEHGCLVPGCHLINVEEVETKGGRMMVFPNPVRGVLNVYLETSASPPTSASGGRGESPTMSLIDVNGKVVKQWRVGGSPTTYIADVSGLEAGVYVLRYESPPAPQRGDRGVVLTEKVIIE